MPHGDLVRLLEELGAPSYRAAQILDWVWRSGATDFDQMSNLPRALRASLADALRVLPVDVATEQVATDGTRKALLRLSDGRAVESVLMPAQGSTGRPTATVCVSTQVGCAAACAFCATGAEGFSRHLTASEIAGQVLFFQSGIQASPITVSRVTNVVFMGQGEPLLNLEPTLEAARALTDPERFGLGERHLTISTVGIVPGILEMARRGGQIGLAISLHAPEDALRSRLVPVNRKYPLATLLDAVRAYIAATGRRVSFEYALLDQVNDHLEQAEALGALLAGMLCHVNLIPMNPVPGLPFQPSAPARVHAFFQELKRRRIPVTVRRQRGAEIMAACGQLKRTRIEDAV